MLILSQQQSYLNIFFDATVYQWQYISRSWILFILHQFCPIVDFDPLIVFDTNDLSVAVSSGICSVLWHWNKFTLKTFLSVTKD